MLVLLFQNQLAGDRLVDFSLSDASVAHDRAGKRGCVLVAHIAGLRGRDVPSLGLAKRFHAILT